MAPRLVSNEERSFVRAVRDEAEVSASILTIVAPVQVPTQLRGVPIPQPRSDSVPEDQPTNPQRIQCLSELKQLDAQSASKLERALQELPQPGDNFAGFRILEALGAGAFGTVYLAEQVGLAKRRVALKIAPDLFSETQSLAQLQHTHIMPIFSAHATGELQAICMPFYGRVTLADWCKELRTCGTFPTSAKMIVSTLQNRLSTVKSLPANSDSVSSIPCPSNGPASGLSTKPITELPEGRRIEEMEYVDAVLWLGSQIASGLTHAHDRGILHRDLKPANILLTDENVPMILDFNLSEDVKSRHASLIARIGGTLPYMSPEQLEIFRGGDRNLDARSDLYSLGLILFQLLTGHHPYRLPKGNLSDVVDTMLADRRKEPPLLTPFNRTISPAVESIVRHCLFANPGDRYASARALREDIELHREHRPLKYAPNPSGMERFWKWTRRNPWVKSPLTLSLVCSVGLFSGATALHSHRDQVRTNEVREMTMHSQQLFQSVTEQINQGRMLMLDWAASPEKLRQGSELLNRAVEKYDAGQNPDWHQERGVQILPEADQTKLREQIEESKQLLSRVRELMNPNTPAMQNLLQQSAPTQIQNLLNTSPAKSSTSVPEVDAATRRQLITDFTSHGRYADAIPYLKQSLKANESDHESWFQLGCCLRMTGDAREAIHAFTATLASKPKWVEALWNRAQLHGSLNDHRSALIDLDSILKLQPDHHEAIIERAVVLCRLQKPQEALTVLAPLMEDAQAPTRVWFIRADIKALLKDQTGAEADRKHGLSLEPNEVQSWNARGFLRMKTDVKGALADLEEAEKLDPRSIHALQNQAHLYGEVLKQPEKALAALDRLLKHHPQYLPAVANRGLYLARLGQVENAVNQAQAALALSQDAYTQFRAACIYARASAMQANFKKDALTHLAKALMNGYGYDLLVNNPDLESLKGDLFFNQLKGFAVLMKSMQK